MTHNQPVSEISMNTKVDEGKLISGKEALIALANGEDVEFEVPSRKEWRNIKSDPWDLDIILNNKFGHKFRLKPRTILINGIEVNQLTGNCPIYENEGVVRIECDTQEHAIHLVSALRQVFGGSHDN